MKKILINSLLVLGLCLCTDALTTPLLAQDTYRVAGRIFTTTGHLMPNVEVTLVGDQQIWLDTTGLDGQYSFADLPGQEDYHLEFKKEGDLANGVTAEDARLLSNYLSLLQKLSINGIFASDVSESNSISPLDAVFILRLSVFGFDDVFNRNWQFIYAYANFSETNPWFPLQELPVRLNVYTLPQLSQHYDNIDFVGSKMGDVNQSADPF